MTCAKIIARLRCPLCRRTFDRRLRGKSLRTMPDHWNWAKDVWCRGSRKQERKGE